MKMQKKIRSKIAVLYRLAATVFLWFFVFEFCLLRNPARYTAVTVVFLVLCLVASRYIEANLKLRFADSVGRGGKFAPYLLFLAALATRCVYCCAICNSIEQISDFGTVLQEAATGVFVDNLLYYRLFSHKLFYPYMLHHLHLRTQFSILLFQCFCVSWIPVVLYFTGKRIKKEKMGILAGVIYIIWPAQIAYVSIVTEEHIAALIVSVLIYWIICLGQRMETMGDGKLQRVAPLFLECILFGALCGLSACFKDWAVIVIAALLISSIYLFFTYNFRQKAILILGIVLILTARTAVCSGTAYFAEKILGVSTSNGVIYWQIYETMDPTGTGSYNEEKFDEYLAIIEKHNYDFEKANKEALAVTIHKLKENIHLIPRFLLYKGGNSYCNDRSMLVWALSTEVKQECREQISRWLRWISPISVVYYLCVAICLLFSCVKMRDRYIFFCILVILGAIVSGLLIECQGRYKYSIEPLWCLVAADGLMGLQSCFREKTACLFPRKLQH